MSAIRAAMYSIAILAVALAAGCSKTRNQGISTGGPSWSTSAENPVPGIDEGTATVSQLMLGSSEGVTVVVWSDLSQGAQRNGKASADKAYVEVSHQGSGGRQVSYRAETTDGETATVTIAGTKFSTSAGNIFLVSTASAEPRVAQINVDIEEFPNEPAEIREFASEHESIEKFFRAAVSPPAEETETGTE